MAASNILFMLLGAAIVYVAVLASALADRIRGLRVSREAAPRERATRSVSTPVLTAVEPAEPLRTPKLRVSREPPKVQHDDNADIVIEALIATKHKKAVVLDAVWACSPSERVTVEEWTRAALRRCVRGAAA